MRIGQCDPTDYSADVSSTYFSIANLKTSFSEYVRDLFVILMLGRTLH